MGRLNRIFNQAKDKNVAVTVVYGDSNKLYADAAHANELTHDEAMDLCFKGAVIFETDTYQSIKSFKESDGTLTVTSAADTAFTVTKKA